ncbi:hypothetical protein Hdeb2414_s0024g00646841 [Helianthus debilis subsp. tardiflorus]
MQTKELKLLLSILLSEASNQRGIFSNATTVYILKSVRCQQLVWHDPIWLPFHHVEVIIVFRVSSIVEHLIGLF